MKFTMSRDRVVASTMGHSIRFEAGVPQFVPPGLYGEVMAAGGVADDEVPEGTKPTSTEPVEPHEREAAMFAAFEKIALANKSGDFTAGGTPRDKAMTRELGWGPEASETATAWKKFKLLGTSE